MNYERELLRGLGATLGEESMLSWVDPEGVVGYAPADAGLYIGVLPSTPARAVAMNAYTVQMFPNYIVGVQFHFAAQDPEDLSVMAQAVADVVEARWGGMLGAVRLVNAVWQSGTPLGQDANGRDQRTDNYYLTLSRTIPNRHR